MNHYTWTYVAGGGRNYPVGLLHSNKSGHLIIYVGAKIVTIDFKVLDTKEYTFFIEDELCHIQLERRGEEMYYFFNIDRKADTPRNRARNAMERKFARQLAAALAIFSVLVAAFVLWSNAVKKSPYIKAEELLVQQGRETVGKIYLKKGDAQPEISYQFVANNQGYTASPTMQTMPLILLKNGMPIEQGDEFIVRYVPSRPEISKMLFDRPTERQIALYRERAISRHTQLHPGEAASTAACMVNVAYQLNGIAGIADFYFQDVPPTANPDHNQNTFLRLTRDLPFKKKVEADCWN
ncbi:MAG: hypothetical protein H6577_07050 [Lewinellaceae bacterium]|nr:hypothetical protein [Saprospiraceae bacterium]MCB9337868.1 hypothetical protein [Lewinellaceae bacterium]